MTQLSPARKAAFAILLEVERGAAHADDLLRRDSVSALSAPDRNLATALVLGVLRWQIALDEHVRPLLKRPGARLDPEVRIALQLGEFQLLHMDRIPARAAIDESVELAKTAGHRFASGMVNAVLRRVARESLPASDPAAAILAHPKWMVERWTKFFGQDSARSICSHNQAQPSLAVRIEDPESEAEFAREGVSLASGELLRAARVVLSGDVSESVAFRAGRVRMQDEGSQLVAEIAGQGSAILDCCAAPGGKTLILAQRNPHARIVACEASPPRFEALRARLAPIAGRIEFRLADAAALAEFEQFDLVLADVPCSGTGTLGRNPEIRHRLQPDQFERHAARQRDILVAALRAARPGGRIIYSTCSLEPEENEQVVAAVLREHSNARVLPMQSRIDEMSRQEILVSGASEKLKQCLTPEGYLRLFPGSFGADGFFVSILGKSAGPEHHSGGNLSSA